MRPSKEIEEASLINSLVRASSSRYQAEIQCLHPSQVAHRAGAYPGFCSMKRLGVFLLPSGWDASQSQGYPQH